MSAPRIEERAAALRRAFDAAFAAPPAGARDAMQDFLAIRVAGDPFAVRVASVSRLAAIPKIVSVPSQRRSVLGVAAIRGALVSVHGLAALLGYASDGGDARWIAIAGNEMVGLAFHELDGFLRVPAGTKDAIASDGITRPIIDIDTVLETITTGRSIA